jgi:hypothetical protein
MRMKESDLGDREHSLDLRRMNVMLIEMVRKQMASEFDSWKVVTILSNIHRIGQRLQDGATVQSLTALDTPQLSFFYHLEQQRELLSRSLG